MSEGREARSYHHGDLREALVSAATKILESGESFSLRAVARAVGVSAAAPYRHFSDREQLESAIAVSGFEQLARELEPAVDAACSKSDIASFAIIYVRFALAHPAVFGLMFGQECDDSNDARVLAAARLSELLSRGVKAALGPGAADSLSIALWSMAHGLASLHMDGKFSYSTVQEVDERVRSSFSAVLQGL
ncbi:TetR family transcriptional regulator [Glutamicibacter uratoxydans]|uniref:TetR family transcriptional regulator n=1 Tax=Glutamicibacter uratoxydans TaxID=43667 RepID=A0A4Y4DMM6_GLUUR|nr:TetR/AcrR family transcriptional regulator [Glutamicibacter uratoxydans]GED04608.1 TetR family transcriptional regulator [Glutamicibacter uratoxydans]